MELDARQLQETIEVCEFDRWLGIRVVELAPEKLTLAMPMRREILGVPKIGRLHGGVIGALIDATGCYLLIALRKKRVSTIDMVVDYLRPAQGDLTATSRVIKIGRTVCVVAVDVHESSGKLVAQGRLTVSPSDVTIGQEQLLSVQGMHHDAT